jgi:hypothetical protein
VILVRCLDSPCVFTDYTKVMYLFASVSPGDIGKMLDSARVFTDYTKEQLSSLSFSDVMEICSYLKGLGELLLTVLAIVPPPPYIYVNCETFVRLSIDLSVTFWFLTHDEFKRPPDP